MPDVNLLRDTKQPTEPPKPPVPPGPGPLSDPSKDARPGLGSKLRSLFGRKGLPDEPAPLRAQGTAARMSVGKTTSQERILSETKRTPRTGVVPLPDDPGNFDVNLLTEDLVSTFNPRQKFIQLGLVALGAVIVIGGAYAGLRFYAGNVTKQVTVDRQQLDSITQQTNQLSGDQQLIASTTNKISAVKSLIDRHIRWSRFFAALQRYTLPTVTYGPSFSGDISGSLTLAATTGSFDDVAKQYLVLQQAVANKDFISSFSINGASETSKGASHQASFTISLVILPELLENVPIAAASTTGTSSQPAGSSSLPTVNINPATNLNTNTALPSGSQVNTNTTVTNTSTSSTNSATINTNSDTLTNTP